ncbi:hypothetical protein L195_g041912, partial [Trifolium pratense]
CWSIVFNIVLLVCQNFKSDARIHDNQDWKGVNTWRRTGAFDSPPEGYAYAPADNVYHSVKLDPSHGFIWEREKIDDGPYEDERKIRPTGWNTYEDQYD